jgi:hypothetical protein
VPGCVVQVQALAVISSPGPQAVYQPMTTRSGIGKPCSAAPGTSLVHMGSHFQFWFFFIFVTMAYSSTPAERSWTNLLNASLATTFPFTQSLTASHRYGSLIRSHTISTGHSHPTLSLAVSLANGAMLESNAGSEGNPFQLTSRICSWIIPHWRSLRCTDSCFPVHPTPIV